MMRCSTAGDGGVTNVQQTCNAQGDAGIAKRELRGVPTHAVKSPADLDGLAAL